MLFGLHLMKSGYSAGRVGSQKPHKLTGQVGSGHGFRGSGRVESGNLDQRATLVCYVRHMYRFYDEGTFTKRTNGLFETT